MEIDGTTYMKGYVMIHDVVEDEPKFCQILDMFQTPAEETLFIVRELKSFFNLYYHAYEVSSVSSISVCKHHQFVDHHPLHVCKGHSCSEFVVLKYQVCLK